MKKQEKPWKSFRMNSPDPHSTACRVAPSRKSERIAEKKSKFKVSPSWQTWAVIKILRRKRQKFLGPPPRPTEAINFLSFSSSCALHSTSNLFAILPWQNHQSLPSAEGEIFSICVPLWLKDAKSRGEEKFSLFSFHFAFRFPTRDGDWCTVVWLNVISIIFTSQWRRGENSGCCGWFWLNWRKFGV